MFVILLYVIIFLWGSSYSKCSNICLRLNYFLLISHAQFLFFFFLSHELSSAAVSCLSKSKFPVQALLNSYYSHALECLFVSGLLIAIAEFLWLTKYSRRREVTEVRKVKMVQRMHLHSNCPHSPVQQVKLFPTRLKFQQWKYTLFAKT